MTFEQWLAVFNTVAFFVLITTIIYYIRRIHSDNVAAHEELLRPDPTGVGDDADL